MEQTKRNQNSRVTLTQVCSFICMIVISLGLVSCDGDAPAPPAKVVDSQRVKVSKGAPEGLVIRHIFPDGSVLIGKPEMSPMDCQIAARSGKFPDYKLEGLAKVNDPFIMIVELEKQRLSSGEVKVVTLGHYVQSTRHH